MKIAVDLTWLRPRCEGGVESYILNVLDGFIELKKDKNFYLFLALDNCEYIKNIYKKSKFNFIVCNTKAFNIKRHVLWQTLFYNKYLQKYDIDLAFFPIDETPYFKSKKIKYSTVIHDIQAKHYPEYFSKFHRKYLPFIWKRILKTSDLPIVTTNYTKQDILDIYKMGTNIEVVPIPIICDDNDVVNFKDINKKYNIEENNYYYTICSTRKHKNLSTLLDMIHKINKENIKDIPKKLVISGVNGSDRDNLLKKLEELNLKESVIFTGFVSNAERNTLIKKCNCFLFPSIFEGFGMPPVEAMKFGAKTITTKCASLPEVTKGKCFYVNDPFNIDDWISTIKSIQKEKVKIYSFSEYDKVKIAEEYLKLFENNK